MLYANLTFRKTSHFTHQIGHNRHSLQLKIYPIKIIQNQGWQAQ